MLFLLTFSTLTFSRFAEGEWGEDGRWTDGIETNFDAQGNLQPFKAGKQQFILPEGKTADDAYMFYTKTQLQTASQFTDTTADTTTIDGQEYYVQAVEDWSKQGMLVAQHYKTLLIRKDQDTNGGL